MKRYWPGSVCASAGLDISELVVNLFQNMGVKLLIVGTNIRGHFLALELGWPGRMGGSEDILNGKRQGEQVQGLPRDLTLSSLWIETFSNQPNHQERVFAVDHFVNHVPFASWRLFHH
ncbi:hypothetical protein, partial [Pseudomonas amygdali]